jgi:membrane protease YdiL (CAAX protease family)
MKDTTAVLVTSLLFTLQHVSFQPMDVHNVYIFVISVVCGVGYSRYENLSVPLILHAAVNIFPLIFFGWCVIKNIQRNRGAKAFKHNLRIQRYGEKEFLIRKF